MKVGVCPPCCSVRFSESPVLCDGSCPVAPEQMCLCNSPVPSPHAWVSRRAEAPHPWPWGCSADRRLMFHDVFYQRPWDHLFFFFFNFFQLIKSFVLSVLIVLDLRCCTQIFSGCGKWGLLSSCGPRASNFGGFSCCGAQAAETQVLRLSWSEACGIFLDQGSNSHILCLLYWWVDSLPLNHQGSPLRSSLT